MQPRWKLWNLNCCGNLSCRSQHCSLSYQCITPWDNVASCISKGNSAWILLILFLLVVVVVLFIRWPLVFSWLPSHVAFMPYWELAAFKAVTPLGSIKTVAITINNQHSSTSAQGSNFFSNMHVSHYPILVCLFVCILAFHDSVQVNLEPRPQACECSFSSPCDKGENWFNFVLVVVLYDVWEVGMEPLNSS
jgi:hypothetical protein